MKSVIAIVCAAFMSVAFGVGSAAHAAEVVPDALIKSTTDDVLAVIRTNKDKRTLQDLAEKKIVSNFDFRQMTQLAVGKHWRNASPAQQKSLEDAFRTLLVNTYTTSLSVAATGKETVEMKPVSLKPGDNDVVVRTVVRSPGRQPIPVDYRLSKNADGWKVYDVIVENLSLVTNYRSSFDSEIARSGIDGLIKALETKNRELAQST